MTDLVRDVDIRSCLDCDGFWCRGLSDRQSLVDVWAKSVSGTIEIQRIKGDAETKTMSGAIGMTKVEGEIGKQRLRGTIGEDDIGIILKTTSGDISLEKA